MTAAEIAILTTERQRLGMMWAGPSLINTELQKDGMTGETTFLDRPVSVPLPEVRAMFTPDEAVAFVDYMATPDSAMIRFYLEGLENPDINHPAFAQLLFVLVSVAKRTDGVTPVLSEETMLSILDLGKRPKTRSEELFGRQLSSDEIKEAIENAI